MVANWSVKVFCIDECPSCKYFKDRGNGECVHNAPDGPYVQGADIGYVCKNKQVFIDTMIGLEKDVADTHQQQDADPIKDISNLETDNVTRMSKMHDSLFRDKK